MQSRDYNKTNIQAVIGKIDSWLRDEEPDVEFKNEVVLYLKENQNYWDEKANKNKDLDNPSLEWALDQISDCKINQTDRIKADILKYLQLFLLIDLLIEQGRQCLINDKGYDSWVDSVYNFLKKHRDWDAEAFDAVSDSLSRKYADVDKSVAVIRDRLERLKLNVMGYGNI